MDSYKEILDTDHNTDSCEIPNIFNDRSITQMRLKLS